MTKEELINLKKQIESLSNEEKKERDLYLRKLALGEIQGPMTGFASIDKPWLKYYSEEDLMIDIPSCKAYDFFVTNNVNNMNSIAINYFGKKVTYGQLIEKINDTTKALYHSGVREGDIVTLIMPICPETVYLFYAINRLGGICNAINPFSSLEELENEIDKTNSKHIFAIDLCHELVEKLKMKKQLDEIVYINPVNSAPFYIKFGYNLKNENKNYDGWNRFIYNGRNEKSKTMDSNYKKDQVLAIVHTGGTTGHPKGVELTNENFVAMAAMYKNGGLNFKKGETFLNFLPPFIAWCLSNGINMPLTLGAEITLVPTFKPEDFPKLMKKYKPNHVLSGPILWELCVKDGITDMSYLKSPVSGGDALPVETERKINDYFKKCGCKYEIAQGYGMTEVTSSATFSVSGSYEEGTVGIPNSKNIISAFDEDGNEVRINEDGELWISTPTLMKGYFQNATATEDIVIKDETGRIWIKTADIGRITPSGHVEIVGRMKRIIVRAGQKIFPSNDENVILQNPNIETCAYVGVPDKEDRYVPALHIVLSDTCQDTLEDVVSQTKDLIIRSLPVYDIPKYFVFRDELPKTNINKIDFKSLEEEEIPLYEITDLRKKEKKLLLK